MSDRLAATRSSYSPAAGGHAPRDLREAFLEGIGYYCERNNRHANPVVEFREKLVPLSQLCALLGRCTDMLPLDAFAELAACSDPPTSRSYAAAARWLRERMQSEPA